MTLSPTKIMKPQEEFSWRIGAPPVSGRPVTMGKSVAVGAGVSVDTGGVSVGTEGVLVGTEGVLVGTEGVSVGTAVDVLVGVSMAVAVPVAVGVSVASTLQTGPVMVLDCKITWPVCTKARPFKVAPVFIVMSVSAKILPTNEVFVSKVAEVPMRHHVLQGSPPVIDEPGDVMRVDTVLKTQTPDPTKLRFPVNEKVLVEQ